jgi:phage antirepressor YoqD-like protein
MKKGERHHEDVEACLSTPNGGTGSTAAVLSTELVPFHGSMLEAGKADDRVWVNVRRMCKGLELDYSGQHQRLSRPASCPWATVGMMPMVAEDGKIREVFCIDLDSVPMWLATIDASRVAPHLREKLVLFQREAAKVLRDHFLGKAPPAPLLTRTEIARMLLIECERSEKLEAEKQVLEHTVDTLVAEVEAADARNAELEPIVETHKELTDANGLSSMTQVAMSVGEGLQRLYQWLREDGFIQPSPSCLPYQQYIDSGLFNLICVPYQKKDKKGVMVDHVRYVTHATAKGLTVLAARYRRGGTHSRWDKPMKRGKKVKRVPTL